MSLAQRLTYVSGIYVYMYIYIYIHILACFNCLVSDVAGSLLYFSFTSACISSERSLSFTSALLVLQLYLSDIPADDLRECDVSTFLALCYQSMRP
jgi:hypothetical protein